MNAAILEEALNLPDAERARLAHELILTLETEFDADAQQAWINEAEERYRAYKAGELKSIPAEEVFSDLRSKLS